MAYPSFSVSPNESIPPYVLALDVGSTGTRAGLYDGSGRVLSGDLRIKVPHAFTTVADGTSVIDPDEIVDEIRRCIDHIAKESPVDIAGVALDTFASSLVGVDKDGEACTPCYTYADSRSSAQVSYLRSMLNEDDTQQRTGTRQHTGYLPARFLWLKQMDRPLFDRVRRWMSIGEYAWHTIIGETAAGTSTAAWTGMLNRHKGQWDDELFDMVGVKVDQLSRIAPPSKPLTPRKKIGKDWPRLADAVWFAPISDGFASSIGAGATDSHSIVAAAATSGAMRVLVEGDIDNLPRGLWCNRIDEKRSILGGALNDVGRAVTWLHSTLQLPSATELNQLLLAEPDPGTPVVLPFFSGERSTGWVGQARAVFHRVSVATTPTDLYRATIEGVALSYQRVMSQLVQVVGRPERILASGRVTEDIPGLMQIMADVLATPVTPVTIKRSTLHGTAIHALDILAPTVEKVMATEGETLMPIKSRQGYYQRRIEHFQVLYDKVIATGN